MHFYKFGLVITIMACDLYDSVQRPESIQEV